MTKITGTLHEDQYTFMTMSSKTLLRMRNISAKVMQKSNTHILYSINIFPKIVPFMR